MIDTNKKIVLAEFRKIPGVGKIIAQDFWDMGLRSQDDLKDADAEELYKALCILKGHQVDRCMLYVFRCAVYFASTRDHDPELLKWWNWKNN